MKHLLSIQDLSNEEIMNLIKETEILSKNKIDLNQYKVGLLFFEPSTRTKMSFEMACINLGIHVLSFSKKSSSVVKGESLYDTVKTLEAIGVDLLVIRDQKERFYEELKHISIPIINAGDGTGEHPTQTLLDLYTIYEEYRSFENLQVVICGDIKHSRVARSNAIALSRLGAKVSFVAKDEWKDERLPFPYIDIDEGVKKADVLMLLRIQKERHYEKNNDENYLQKFGLTKEREEMMKRDSIIMHPAPVNRGVEIDSELVECPRSRIFKQMSNGVLIRQTILKHYLTNGGEKHENFN